jgi:Zn-dependent peptidase ImmA (M78 family)
MSLPWSKVHMIAILEAVRAHKDLAVDRTKRIDPFAALEAAGVLTMRQRLDNMAGAYLTGADSESNTPGALVNAAHPLSKQRYTAAHELAHHRRDRQYAFDKDTEWLGRVNAPTDDRERIAEAFAAHFLMPQPLIRQFMRELQMTPENLDAGDAYLLALELGTSYQATIRQLYDIRVIPTARRNQLLAEAPQAIKIKSGAADVLADSWKDVWMLRESHRYHPVHAMEGDAVVVDLAEIPSSGYVWDALSIPQGLVLVREEYTEENHAAVGGIIRHHFVFRVEAICSGELELAMYRPWEPHAVIERYSLAIRANSSPRLGLVHPNVLAAVA